MSAEEIALVMRMGERLIAVIIGGLSVYLGFRLFMALPDKVDASGKIIMPGGIDIKLSRVGPGIFFALFGVSIVISSYHYSIKLLPEEKPHAVAHPANILDSSADREIAFIGVASSMEASPISIENRQAEARRQILVLNRKLPESLKPGVAPADRNQLLIAVEYAKKKILRDIWDEKWGAFISFEIWLNNGAPEPVPEQLTVPASIFNTGRIENS